MTTHFLSTGHLQRTAAAQRTADAHEVFELAETAPLYIQFAPAALIYRTVLQLLCLPSMLRSVQRFCALLLNCVLLRLLSDGVAARERAAQRAVCYRASQFVTAA